MTTKTIGHIIGMMHIGRAGSDFPLHIRVRDARQTFWMLLRQCMPNAQWLPGYDGIADWLTDNDGKGLLLVGGCGTGKTVIATRIIPHVVHCLFDRNMAVYKARWLNYPEIGREAEAKYLKVIDDIGSETKNNYYGVHKWALTDIVDTAEEMQHFLILTTNMTKDNITARYGERTVDRLRVLCRTVVICSKSMRQ